MTTSRDQRIDPTGNRLDPCGRSHRGEAICAALSFHAMQHDGYADNAQDYINGYSDHAANVRGEYPDSGPARTAYTAGWLAYQRVYNSNSRAIGREPINGPAPVEDEPVIVHLSAPLVLDPMNTAAPIDYAGDATERARLAAFDAMIESRTDDLRADLYNTERADLDEQKAREIVLLANERGIHQRSDLTAYALGYIDGQDDQLDPSDPDAPPTEHDHDLHGGAAGSFAPEGCAECAEIDAR